MDFDEFIGKEDREIEHAFGFTHYLEIKDRFFNLGKDQNHEKIVDAFFTFVGNQKIKAVKTDNGVTEKIFDVSKEVVRKNLLLLEKDKGLFYDDALEISYAILGKDFFAYVLSSMLMFSANEENIGRMAQILDDHSLKYVEPYELEKTKGKHSGNSKIYQLKIALDGIEPKIWRRFLVEDSMTFHEIHQIIQRFMGWGNYHAYDFIVGDVCIGGEGDSPFCVDSMWRGFTNPMPSESATRTEFRDFIKKEKQKFRYVYDLGDNWVHLIIVEKILDKEDKSYPILLGGERACPPDDCGGIHGYYDLLEIRKDPSHPLYKERIVDWLGEDFDPEYFDVNEANASLQSQMLAPSKSGKLRKLGRNEPCYCGSGEKYKKCCLKKDIKELGRARKIPVSHVSYR